MSDPTTAQIPLGEFMLKRGGATDPAKEPDETFILYSIPAFDAGEPEVVVGSSIGSPKKDVREGDVLLSRIVPHIRRSWIVGPHDERRVVASGEWIVFRSDRVHAPYLRHFLVSDVFHRQFMQTVAGVGGSLLRAKPDYVAEITIPLPPLDEQRRIAAILDKADVLRRKRKHALDLLDGLTQSIFLEMFGDPISNPKGLNQQPLGNIIKVKSGNGLTANQMAPEGKIPVYGGNGINGYHSAKMFDKPMIVIGRVGAYCGAVHMTAGPSWVTDNALYVSNLRQEIDQTYLLHSLRYADLNQYAGRAAQPLISGSRIYPVEISVPESKIQKVFSEAVASVSKYLGKIDMATVSLDTLFASLQSRAFSGQL